MVDFLDEKATVGAEDTKQYIQKVIDSEGVDAKASNCIAALKTVEPQVFMAVDGEQKVEFLMSLLVDPLDDDFRVIEAEIIKIATDLFEYLGEEDNDAGF
jgi:hypothetical protein